jgi:predicted DNA-binding transcriptional regulator AlpA
MQNSTDLIDTKAAAEYLGGLSVSLLEQYRTRGTGPSFVKIGHLVRYRRCDLDAWVADRVQQSTAGNRRKRSRAA